MNDTNVLKTLVIFRTPSITPKHTGQTLHELEIIEESACTIKDGCAHKINVIGHLILLEQ